MHARQSFGKSNFSPASLPGQGVGAAPQGVLCGAKYGARKTRNCGKPGFCRRQKWPQKESCPPTWGIVADNRDPDCLGRLRIQLDMAVPGFVSPWYQSVSIWSGKENGIWAIPDPGTQVLVIFPGGDYSHGLVLGCIYDSRNLPPVPANGCTENLLWQTKNHRVEIIEEDDKEGILIETAKGRIRCEISKNEGIKIINELGPIKIKCRKLIINARQELKIKAANKISLKAGGQTITQTRKGISINSDQEISIKGQNIRLDGSTGVTAEGRQLAAESDMVAGMDVHNTVVPSGSGTATIPLPHPFIGKLADGLSNSVKIKDKACATKDSIAKHNDSMHMQLPGTIKFQNNPKKEGNVTGGTSSKVKIVGNYGKAVIVGHSSGTGVYLAAHLSNYNEKVLKNGYVTPGEIIGFVGGTGAGGEVKFVPHLHVTYFHYSWKENENIKLFSKNKDTLNATNTYYKVSNKNTSNPFNHMELFK